MSMMLVQGRLYWCTWGKGKAIVEYLYTEAGMLAVKYKDEKHWVYPEDILEEA